MRQIFKSDEGDRTGELGTIRPSDELSDSEQLSQINRFEGYVQIEGWERVESTNNVRIEIRYPNGSEGEAFMDWPEESFEDSGFGEFVYQMGYTAETVDMINDTTELFPYDDGKLGVEETSDVKLSDYVGEAIVIFIFFPVFFVLFSLDFLDGSYWDLPPKLADAAHIWMSISAFFWTVNITTI